MHSHKETIVIGRTKIITFIDTNHPVYLGVGDALAMLGGSLPEHVRRVEITPATLAGTVADTVICGQCIIKSHRCDIVIYAGSITAAVDQGSLRWHSRMVTLHEVGHSHFEDQVQQGLRFDESVRLSRSFCENEANEYVDEVLRVQPRKSFQQRINQ